jgi:hypothetical protein
VFGSWAGAIVGHVGAIDDAVVSWREIVTLPWGTWTFVFWRIVYLHVIFLEHAAHLRRALCHGQLETRKVALLEHAY